ncbi:MULTISPECIES: metal ABC transporter permease [Parafrankia]|uniref:Manganese transporter n=1 Tax=Parafrankia soli TaxID=2599596 RepID=A0A1S1PX12_9ACTN|nr:MULTISPECIES: metal ABC transporter permease [Parafrankia]OHV27208.1 manganese transporter [Parafrankia soli]TCJ35444.1 metal ABC transporter permease [Parafrankia sp. BMG5.11]SQE00277.1 ABC-3 protein [Parafrankia sp. Ea1.12]
MSTPGDLLIAPFERPFMYRALLEVLLLGTLSAVVGVLVLLRRLAFLTDALTHAVFPGVVIGFLIAGDSGIVPGALLVAVAAAAGFTALVSTRRVTEDAAMAMLLTGCFAVGVVLVSRRESYTSDLTAFLFGRLLTVDSTDITVTAVTAAVALAVLALIHKELLLRAFDPEGARAAGYPVWLLDLVLNLVIALVVVAAVRAVGTVLVIALIVIPAAAARLLSDRLVVIVLASIGLGVLGGWLGLVASYEASVRHEIRLAAGATVVLALVVIYALALLVAMLPRRSRGARSRERRQRRPASSRGAT